MKVDLYKEIKKGSLTYSNKEDFWNPSKQYKSHHVYSYIADQVKRGENSLYKKIKPHLGVIPKIIWFRSIDQFIKTVNILYGYNQIVSELFGGGDKVMFQIINNTLVKPKEPHSANQIVKKFTLQANRALRYHSKLQDQANKFFKT